MRTKWNVKLKLVLLPLMISGIMAFRGISIPTHVVAEQAGNFDQPPESLVVLQQSFREVAKSVLPIVVEINVIEVFRQKIPQPFSPWEFFFGPSPGQTTPEEREFRKTGLGSGVIVRQTGDTVYVLTNNHVVRNAEQISVHLYDGRQYRAEIAGRDSRTDLALIRFNSIDTVPVARLGDSNELQIGDLVLAVGNPFGFESTVTAGIVSALGRTNKPGSSTAAYTDYIQTDAAINPGNSGGALVNILGEVIGINTWIASTTGGSVGLGFAVPINNAKKVIEDIIVKGRVEYGWLGVSTGDYDAQEYMGISEDLGINNQDGVLVLNIFRDSPADRAGILPGDFIIKVNNFELKNSRHLTLLVGNTRPQANMDFSVIRYGKEETIFTTIGYRESEEEAQISNKLWPGLVVTRNPDEVKDKTVLSETRSGVMITKVLAGTHAHSAGLRPGDLIVKVNEESTKTVTEFYKAMNAAKGEIHFRVLRQGREILLGLTK